MILIINFVFDIDLSTELMGLKGGVLSIPHQRPS